MSYPTDAQIAADVAAVSAGKSGDFEQMRRTAVLFNGEGLPLEVQEEPVPAGIPIKFDVQLIPVLA